MTRFRMAIIGFGKIAEDQHLPVISADPDFDLAAIVSRRGVTRPGVPTFRTPAELYASGTGLDAVAICTPPPARHAAAREALDAGVHVLLEKPPTPTLAELDDLAAHAAARGRVLFTTWHSQYNDAVDDAQARLEGRRIAGFHIEWKEDVRRWHPGQDWIWEVGGFGVFDPGINALSILTRIMPGPVFVRQAELVYPSNRDTPIAAALVFASPAAADTARLTAAFDWRQVGDQTWAIDIAIEGGEQLRLTAGGARLEVNGTSVTERPSTEYQAIYRRFADLLRRGEAHVDKAPFQLVADAFMTGRRTVTSPFET